MKMDMNILGDVTVNHRSVAPGREIYAEGESCDSIFVVLDGWAIQHQILEDGRRQILDFALPGALLGLQTAGEDVMSHTAECLTTVTVAAIPRAQLPQLFERNPKFALRFTLLAAETINSAYQTLTDVGRRTAREAVAHILLRLYLRIGAGQDGQAGDGAADVVDFPLTLEHIGDALGLTGVHICRTLRSLREDNIVHLSRGKLRIMDFLGLIEAAGCGADKLSLPEGFDRHLYEKPCAPAGVVTPLHRQKQPPKVAAGQKLKLAG